MKTWLMLTTVGILFWTAAEISAAGESSAETTAGWVKCPKNPVLGGDLGTCFDLSILKEGDTYRMWFSWRPKKSIALVESKDGVEWTAPLIVIGPNDKTDWENDLNRPSIIKNGELYQMWYTGQAQGKSWIGYAASHDGKTWRREGDQPVLSAEEPWEKVASPMRLVTQRAATAWPGASTKPIPSSNRMAIWPGKKTG
jgi:hypothetical protein